MNDLWHTLGSTLLIGLGATLTFDLGAILLKQAFNIAPSDICLVGRWLRYMPAGIFWHSNIRSAAQQRGECPIGWTAHYLIGIAFAIGFVAVVGDNWLQQPRVLPAITYGIITVLAPFLIMQPALGLGLAAAKTPNPLQARLRSLLNHTTFGLGLYFFGWLVNGIL